MKKRQTSQSRKPIIMIAAQVFGAVVCLYVGIDIKSKV